MAIAFVNVGTADSGTGATTPGIPAGVQVGDLLLMFVQTSGNAVSNPAAPQAWLGPLSFAGGQDSAFNGLTSVANACALTIFYRFVDGSEGTTSSCLDLGDHAFIVILAWRGVHPTLPFVPPTIVTHLSGTGESSSTSTPTTTLNYPAFTASPDMPNLTVISAAALSLDSASTTTTSGFTNAGLSAIAERADQTATAGTGGGIVVYEGFKAAAGALAASSATITSSAYAAGVFALRSNGVPALSSPGATSVTSTTATPQVTATF